VPSNRRLQNCPSTAHPFLKVRDWYSHLQTFDDQKLVALLLALPTLKKARYSMEGEKWLVGAKKEANFDRAPPEAYLTEKGELE